MSGFARSSIAALAVIACITLSARADDKDDIKAAGKAFHVALAASDIPAAKKHMVSDDKTDKFLETMTAMISAKKKLIDAAVSKFGEDGRTIVAPGRGPGSMISIDHNFDDAEIEVTGDTATVTFKNGPSRPTMFKKDGGSWKIDFTEIAHQDQVERGLPIMEKMSTAMTESATDINDGKYETLQDAKVGYHKKMIAAAGFPGGGPDGQ